ncbi:hypothetical protein CXG81DRAFT_26393 [Caulochytrium protostelioides]|uniref:Uncharacterized protein n=1 Tax=Caulochytrium protostelioides TaxID=1555241 RepID=A0A4P9X6U3_9FUNG|nr:hypothetical protein CXG81DRAFT_26393 [Caulochytrium protostelioides]|eukprot:RKP00905.1 hypothetical protein CXG81DRAFT_26393 [Caulochytrium protostelioides]
MADVRVIAALRVHRTYHPPPGAAASAAASAERRQACAQLCAKTARAVQTLVGATGLRAVLVAYPAHDPALAAGLLAALRADGAEAHGLHVATDAAAEATPSLPPPPGKALVRLVAVAPWGAFVPALNALLVAARQTPVPRGDGGACGLPDPSPAVATHVLFISVEVTLQASALATLCRHAAQPGILVVGPALEGHTLDDDPVAAAPATEEAAEAAADAAAAAAAVGAGADADEPIDADADADADVDVDNQNMAPPASETETETSERPLSGTTCPWNTCALWHLAALQRTGFLGVSEGLALPDGTACEGGVEEVAVVALHQHLRLPIRGARLLVLPPAAVVWATTGTTAGGSWETPERAAWHRRKMASKQRRAADQGVLLRLPLSRGRVELLISKH